MDGKGEKIVGGKGEWGGDRKGFAQFYLLGKDHGCYFYLLNN
jgi:hypothetical protein